MSSNVNAPNSWELLIVPEGMKKISMKMDTKIPNSASFKVLKEDHTLGNMLRMKLLENPKVLFCGYKMAHPLEHEFILNVQTATDTTPLAVLREEIDNLIIEVTGIMRNFQDELTQFTLN